MEDYRPRHNRIVPLDRYKSLTDTVSVLERRVIECDTIGDVRWHVEDGDGVVIKRFATMLPDLFSSHYSLLLRLGEFTTV